MDHEKFVQKLKDRKINAYIDPTKAVNLATNGYFGKAEKYNAKFWTWLSLILYITSPISLIWISWYWSVLIFIIAYLVWKANNQSSQQLVLEKVINDSGLYYILIDSGVLMIKEIKHYEE